MTWDENRTAFVESAAQEFAAAGFPAIPARMIMALTASDEGRLTAEELMGILGVSRAAISNAVRFLAAIGYVRTATVPGTRKHVYVLPERPWYTATLSRPGQFHQYAASITSAAATLPAGPARDRVDEMIDFFDYLETRLPQLMVEWQDDRRRRLP